MKRISSMSILLLLIVTPAVLAGGGQKVAATKAPAGVVAIIHGRAVTQADLEGAVGSRLMRVRTEEYNIRRAALDQLVAERLFEAEAARRDISKEELFRIEVEDKVPVVSNETIAEVYEGVKDRFGNMEPQEAMRQLATGMRRQKVEVRRAELTRALAGAAGVKIYLEPPRSEVRADGEPAKGSASAPISIVEYSDFECTFCSRAIPTIRKLQERYGDRVRFAYRDYIIPSHRSAPKAAEAAHCAGDQGKYWEMHDRLFEQQRTLSPIEFIKWAREMNLDAAAFEQCLASGKHQNTWQTSHAEGDRAGVRSTPTFFINGRMIIGAANLEMFTRVIDEELQRVGLELPPVTTSTVTATK